MSDNHSIEGAEVKGAGEFTLFTRRISSCSVRDCGIVFASLALVSLVIAVVFAALGAWLILPFAGLEVIALYLAFDWIARHADDSESLEIRGNAVLLAVRERAQMRCYEFNRAWAHVVVDAHASSVRLALRSHGREVEIGRYLDGDGKRRLARELKSRLNVR